MHRVIVIATAFLVSCPFAFAEERLAWKVVGLKAGETVNMRSGPDVSFGIVTKIPHHAGIVTINGECVQKGKYNWCPVQWKDHEGFVADAYLQKVRLVTRKDARRLASGAAGHDEAPADAAGHDEARADAAGHDEARADAAGHDEARADAAGPGVAPDDTATVPHDAKQDEAPAAPPKDDKGIYFVYHQKKPLRNPTGCMKVDATKLPAVDALQPVEGAIGKRVTTTSCCEADYVYFGNKSSCQAYSRAHVIVGEKEEDPAAIPDEVNSF